MHKKCAQNDEENDDGNEDEGEDDEDEEDQESDLMMDEKNLPMIIELISKLLNTEMEILLSRIKLFELMPSKNNAKYKKLLNFDNDSMSDMHHSNVSMPSKYCYDPLRNYNFNDQISKTSEKIFYLMKTVCPILQCDVPQRFKVIVLKMCTFLYKLLCKVDALLLKHDIYPSTKYEHGIKRTVKVFYTQSQRFIDQLHYDERTEDEKDKDKDKKVRRMGRETKEITDLTFFIDEHHSILTKIALKKNLPSLTRACDLKYLNNPRSFAMKTCNRSSNREKEKNDEMSQDEEEEEDDKSSEDEEEEKEIVLGDEETVRCQKQKTQSLNEYDRELVADDDNMNVDEDDMDAEYDLNEERKKRKKIKKNGVAKKKRKRSEIEENESSHNEDLSESEDEKKKKKKKKSHIVIKNRNNKNDENEPAQKKRRLSLKKKKKNDKKKNKKRRREDEDNISSEEEQSDEVESDDSDDLSDENDVDESESDCEKVKKMKKRKKKKQSSKIRKQLKFSSGENRDDSD